MDRSAALCERASDALKHSPIPALRQLRVEECESRVVLTGELSSYCYKQLAQQTVLPLLGGREFINGVQVIPKNL